AELPRQWITLVQAEIDRDWTWRGQRDPLFRLKREIQLLPGGPTFSEDLGTVQMQHTVSLRAAAGALERDRVHFAFLDAFVPPLRSGLPYELQVSYQIRVELENGTGTELVAKTHLPVTS